MCVCVRVWGGARARACVRMSVRWGFVMGVCALVRGRTCVCQEDVCVIGWPCVIGCMCERLGARVMGVCVALAPASCTQGALAS